LVSVLVVWRLLVVGLLLWVVWLLLLVWLLLALLLRLWMLLLLLLQEDPTVAKGRGHSYASSTPHGHLQHMMVC
jgi:hypothetical protein